MSISGAKTTLSLEESFIEAARNNQLHKMIEIHKSGCFISPPTCLLALSFASLHGYSPIVTFIFDKILSAEIFKDPKTYRDGYFSALYAASQEGHLDIVKIFLNHPAKKLLTPLHLGNTFRFALKEDNATVMNYLLKNHLSDISQFFLENFSALPNYEIAKAFFFTLSNDLYNLSFFFLENCKEILLAQDLTKAIQIIRERNKKYDLDFQETLETINEYNTFEQSDKLQAINRLISASKEISAYIKNLSEHPLKKSKGTRMYPELKPVSKNDNISEMTHSLSFTPLYGTLTEKEEAELSELFSEFELTGEYDSEQSDRVKDLREQGIDEQDIAAIIEALGENTPNSYRGYDW